MRKIRLLSALMAFVMFITAFQGMAAGHDAGYPGATPYTDALHGWHGGECSHHGTGALAAPAPHGGYGLLNEQPGMSGPGLADGNTEIELPSQPDSSHTHNFVNQWYVHSSNPTVYARHCTDPSCKLPQLSWLLPDGATLITQCAQHSFGAWAYHSSTQHKRTCTICGYTEYQNHSYGSWSQNGAAGHKRTCGGCGDTETAAHSGNPCTECGWSHSVHTYGAWAYHSATQHKRSCDICNYTEYANHSYGAWSSNGSSGHKRTCSACGYADTAPHTSSTSCSVCGWTHTHSYGSWSSSSSTQHKRTCSVCGNVDYQNHSFGSWSSSSSTQHKRTCSVCGYVDYQNHSFGAWANHSSTQHKRTCSVCGYVDYQSHTYGSWSQNGAAGHKRTCSGCGYVETAAHSGIPCSICGWSHSPHNFTKWTYHSASQHKRACDVCNYTEYANHTYGSWSQNGAAGHKRTCSGCGDVDTAGHTFGVNANCSVCGYPHSHTWGSWQKNSTHHWKTCTTGGCSAQSSYAAHNYGTGTSCTSQCGQTHSHSYASAWSYNSTQHWHACVTAGCSSKSGVANHNFVQYQGGYLCTVCGYGNLLMSPPPGNDGADGLQEGGPPPDDTGEMSGEEYMDWLRGQHEDGLAGVDAWMAIVGHAPDSAGDDELDKYVTAPFSYDSSHGESINLNSGDLTYLTADAAIPGVNGLDLTLARRYDSGKSMVYEPGVSEKWVWVLYGYKLYLEQKYFDITTGAEVSFGSVNGYYSQDIYSYIDVAILAMCMTGDHVYYYVTPDGVTHALKRKTSASLFEIGDYIVNQNNTNLTPPNAYTDTGLGLGSGWSFAFSSIEFTSGKKTYLHTAEGGTYQYEPTSAAGDSNLKDYTLGDLRLEKESGGHNGAEYTLYRSDGRREHFDASGRLMAIRDRYGNQITSAMAPTGSAPSRTQPGA